MHETVTESARRKGYLAPDQASDLYPVHLSYEYQSSAMVAKCIDPELRADVARIWIKEMIAEGNYARAAESLLYGGIPEADIPEMQTPDFIGFLYQQELLNNNHFGAHRIASMVKRLNNNGEIGKLFKTGVTDSGYSTGWGVREVDLFEKGTQEILKEAFDAVGSDTEIFNRLLIAYQGWSFREDGPYSEHPHPLAHDVTRLYSRFLFERGAYESAYRTAIEANLPYGDVITLEDKIPGIDGIKIRFMSRLRRMFKLALKPRVFKNS